MPRSLSTLGLVLLVAAPALAAPDLAETYPPTLDVSAEPVGIDWLMTPSDVHRLSSFSLALPGGTALAAAESTLVVGRHGTDAMLAVVLPDAPGRLVSKESGEEKFAAVFLRFHPARIGEVFPAETVAGPGPARALLAARHMAAAKLGNSMQIDGLPVVPARKLTVVDADTTGGARRFFLADAEAGTTRYVAGFAGRPTPPAPADPISKEDALAALDATWSAFEKEYPMFGLRPDADWAALREAYRPLAAEAKTAYEAALALGLLLANLRDLHVWVKLGGEYVPVWNRFRPLNANGRVTQALAGGPEKTGPELSVGTTPDGIGYLCVWGLTDPALPDLADAALERLSDTKALVIDLRFNGGGDESLAQRIAGRFAAEAAVYGSSRRRVGGGHDELLDPVPRALQPRGPWRYEKPVVVLQGRRTMSSAESFVAMLGTCPEVTTMGAPTAGSSGNPRVLELPAGITVTVPRWLDLGPDGEPIDERGILPDVPVPCVFSDLKMSDPVIIRALTFLRERTK